MLEVIAIVADRLVSLLKAGQERDRRLHADFFVDFASDMEILHKNYLETFAGYREALQRSEMPLSAEHPLIELIERDVVFTEQIRAKVRSLAAYENDPVFGPMAKSAAIYLSGGSTCAHVLINGRRLMNAARGSAIQGLKQLFAQQSSPQEKLKAGIALLDEIVIDLQQAYQSFLKASANTKRELLDSRL